jgi:hypothetical protein
VDSDTDTDENSNKSSGSEAKFSDGQGGAEEHMKVSSGSKAKSSDGQGGVKEHMKVSSEESSDSPNVNLIEDMEISMDIKAVSDGPSTTSTTKKSIPRIIRRGDTIIRLIFDSKTRDLTDFLLAVADCIYASKPRHSALPRKMHPMIWVDPKQRSKKPKINKGQHMVAAAAPQAQG